MYMVLDETTSRQCTDGLAEQVVSCVGIGEVPEEEEEGEEEEEEDDDEHEEDSVEDDEDDGL